MNAEQERYIIERWDKMSCEALRRVFNEEFGTSYKVTAFHYHTKRLGLSKHIEHKYTAEQDAYLKENAGKVTRKELTKAFNERYGTQIKENAIEMRCYLRGLAAKSDGQFKTGSVPWGKTKGGRAEYVKKLKGGNSTSFKKGQIPMNAHEVGTVTEWDNKLMIKTKDGWVTCLRHLWENRRGKVPDGYVVISVLGEKETDDITTLRAIPNRVWTTLIANRWNGKGAEIVDTGVLWSELKAALDAAWLKEEGE